MDATIAFLVIGTLMFLTIIYLFKRYRESETDRRTLKQVLKNLKDKNKTLRAEARAKRKGKG